MSMSKTLFAVSVLFTCGRPALAAESQTARAMRQSAPKGITEAFYACVDKAGFDQARIVACIGVERTLQDARLNKAYGKLMSKLDSKPKESLRIAERAWLDFNTKSVTAETDIGGANQITNVDVSEAELFRYCERANVLDDYLFAVGE